jgi:hypothetical protein
MMNPNELTYTSDRLTLRIKHTDFVSALRAHGVPPEQMPVTRSLCGELIVSYAFDMPEQFVMATPPLLNQAGLNPSDIDSLDTLAQANFKGTFAAQLHSKADCEGVMYVQTGKDLEAVMLMFDRFWSGHVKSLVQGDIVVCAPSRSTLLIADTAIAGSLVRLKGEAAKAFDQSQKPHALSLQLMKWTDNGWELFALHTIGG